MIINGVNITTGTKETDLDTDGKAKKTDGKKADSKGKTEATDENDLVELSLEDDAEDSATSSYEEAIANAQKQQEQQIQAYLQQIQNLMSQLSTLNQQQNSLASNMLGGDGGEISSLQSSFQSISSQKKQVYSNIINLLMTINQYEQQMAANNKNMQSLLDQIKSTTASLSDPSSLSLDSLSDLTGTGATDSTQGLNPANSTGNTNLNATKNNSNYMSKYNSARGGSLASAARSLYGGVKHGNSLCATGVAQAIKKAFGYQLHGNGCDYGNVLSGRSDWMEITDQIHGVEDLKKLPAGAVVSWSPYNTTSAGNKFGHVYICDGNGHGLSDFEETISSYYLDRQSKFRVFIPV